MAQSTMESLGTINKMAKESFSMQMEIIMRENTRMGWLVDMGSTFRNLEFSMKENG
jgi:hypothetical protein